MVKVSRRDLVKEAPLRVKVKEVQDLLEVPYTPGTVMPITTMTWEMTRMAECCSEESSCTVTINTSNQPQASLEFCFW
jgi:hypothetical protein